MHIISISRGSFHVCVVFAFIVYVYQPVFARATDDTEQLISLINEYMAAAERVDRFNGTILVARDGKPIVSRGYGMANFEWDIPNSPMTVFRLGSITKQFTAAAIMLLQEQGKLSVDDRICKYVSDCPSIWETITIHHLLTHTSGIPNYTSFPDFFAKKSILPLTPPELLAEFREKPLDFAVGEKYNYSNSGYHLLGIVIEKASGKPYDEFLRENIFKPLGMKQSGYDFSKDIIKQRASGYLRDEDGFINAPYLDMWIPYAAGSLYSTTVDLLTWEQSFRTEKLLKKTSIDLTFTPFKNNYGYGWNIGKRFKRITMSHGGAINGFATSLIRFPEDKVTVIVLSNVQGSGVGKIAGDLSAIVFGEKYELPKERIAINLPSGMLDQFVGEYELSQMILKITNEDEKLMLSIPAQRKMQLFAETPTDFFLKAVDAQITFVKNTDGKVTHLLFRQGGGSGMRAEKIK